MANNYALDTLSYVVQSGFNITNYLAPPQYPIMPLVQLGFKNNIWVVILFCMFLFTGYPPPQTQRRAESLQLKTLGCVSGWWGLRHKCL